MKPTVLLYDVDGTIVSTGGAGRRAIDRAFARCFGRTDAVAHLRFDGMTDRAIVREGLRVIDEPATDAAIDRVLACYLDALGREVADAECIVHEGILDSLERAAARSRCAIGLGTGNIEAGARVKLGRVGLAERFAFGGFGCDAEDRAELIRVGAERGAGRLGVDRAQCRVVVIGDTPLDVAAALAIGAECVGVGTGRFTPEALLAAGATAAFGSLADPGAIELLLG